MAPSIGVNLRVTGHCSQGGRKHMEDMFSVAYQQTEDDKDLEYAFFGIFDGHGGREAAMFAKDHLMDFIVNQKAFWSDSDEEVMRAIKEGFMQTHYAMWRELETWPRTASGLPSTAGTTASIAFIRKGKIYIGHVGDSQIILGFKNEGQDEWDGIPLTREHKPESDEEIARIQKSGGKVVSKQGVPRVVWNRPRIGHKGPVRRSTHIDEIPFLAVARSLGDLWSYNSELDEFVVSPEPDVEVVDIKVGVHKCLIFGTDGLWNMMTPNLAAQIVKNAERHNEKHVLEAAPTHQWINPSKSLVDRALGQWSMTCMRADNTSAVTLMLDPPGPPRVEVLRKRTNLYAEDVLTQYRGPKGCVAVFTRHAVASSTDRNDTNVTTSRVLSPSKPIPPPLTPNPLPTSAPVGGGVHVDIKVQINEVSSSIGEAGSMYSAAKEEMRDGVPISVKLSPANKSETSVPQDVASDSKAKHEVLPACVGKPKVLQSTNIKKHVDSSETKASYAEVKRLQDISSPSDSRASYVGERQLRDVSSPSDSRFFRRRPEREDDTSDAENCDVSWAESIPDVENIDYVGSNITPEKLVSSTIPNRSLLKREHSVIAGDTSDRRRLRSSTVVDSPVRTLRSRNVDILLRTSKIKSKKIHSILAQIPKIKRLNPVSIRPLTSKRCKPIILRRRLRKRLAK